MQPDPKWITVNLNQTCRVKLTDLGRRLHRENHYRFWAAELEKRGSIPKAVLEYPAPKEDADGWSEWQVWILMMEFGPALGEPSPEMPFGLDIQMKRQDAPTKRPGLPWFTMGASLIGLGFAGLSLAGYSAPPVVTALAFAAAGFSMLHNGIDQIMERLAFDANPPTGSGER